MKDKIDEMIESLDAWHSDTLRGHKVYFADAVLESLKELKSEEKEDKKYTKKYSKRNGIHQVGLKEDKH